MKSHATKHLAQFLLAAFVIGGTWAIQTAFAEDKQLYTCGMHPQVVQEGPGTCPICSMDLTPMKRGTAGAKSLAPKGERKIKYWRAPMDPSYIRDKPGKSPMGMDLVPVYEDEETEGVIAVDPVMVQNMGVRVATLKRGDLSRSVRTVGEVVVAEDLVSVVNLKYSGWIEKLYVDQTGVYVKKGQPLFRIYSPELVAAQDEYLLAVRSAGKDSPLAQSAKAKLGFWDLREGYIKRIEAQDKAQRALTITAPRAGYVLHKNVVEGARAMAGQDLFRIGKLSAIWVHAQIYEFDAPWVRVGQAATMELAFQRGRLYTGRVSYIYPTLNEKTRTLTVRLEFINPELQLKPGMFTTVRITSRKKTDVLKIPTEAILYSGKRLLVFVAKDVGKYEPREITTGMSGDDHTTEVLSGLKEGEKVVVSGQFLLDSESQLQEAVQKLMAARLHKGDQPQAMPEHAEHDHESHKSSSTGEDTFACPMHPQVKSDKAGSCPICGMELVKKEVVPGEKP